MGIFHYARKADEKLDFIVFVSIHCMDKGAYNAI